MSYEATGWAYEQEIDNSSAKFVLVVLANFADEQWTCFPGQKRISRMTGMSERTVRRSLEWLETEGYISRQHRTGPTGRRTSDRYQLIDPPATVTTGQSDRLASSQVTPTGQNDHRPNCPTQPVRLAGQEPSVEPSDLSHREHRPEKTTIPHAFAMSSAMRAWALEHAPAVEDLEFQTEQFVDYWLARGDQQRDWVAMWRQWMRNQERWRSERRRTPQLAGHTPFRNTDYSDNPDPWA